MAPVVPIIVAIYTKAKNLFSKLFSNKNTWIVLMALFTVYMCHKAIVSYGTAKYDEGYAAAMKKVDEQNKIALKARRIVAEEANKELTDTRKEQQQVVEKTNTILETQIVEKPIYKDNPTCIDDTSVSAINKLIESGDKK